MGSDKEIRNKKSYDHDEGEITVGGGAAMLSWSVMVSCFLHLQNFTTNIPKNYYLMASWILEATIVYCHDILRS